MINNLEFSKIIVIPCGIREDKKYEVSCLNRLEILKLSINDYFTKKEKKKIEVDDIEIKNGKFIPTYFLIKEFQKKYENIWFLCGSDVLHYLHKFQEFEKLKKEVNFIIVKRNNYSIKGFENNLPKNYIYYDNWDSCETLISSSQFRQFKHNDHNYFLTKSVIEYIKKFNLYD